MEIGYKRFPTELSVELPISKSILARQLVLDYVYKTPLADRLSQLEGRFIPLDIKYISEALLELERRRIRGDKESIGLYVGQSGTAYRFLLVLALFETGDVIISHNPQLTKRIKEVDLQPFIEVGAEIEFYPKKNKTHIISGRQISGTIEDSQWNTSQFSSAIQLTWPLHKGEIKLIVDEKRSSYSYYQLTKEIINDYNKGSRKTEGDWSAAAFWYELMVMHPEIQQIELTNLNHNSPQPDKAVQEIFDNFGIKTDTNNRLIRKKPIKNKFEINLSQSLDLFPSVMLSALWLGVAFEISGIKNLRVKESDRIASVLNNLKAIGINDIIVEDDIIIKKEPSNVTRGTFKGDMTLNSYDDHRIAMAFGVWATAMPDIKYNLINEKAVSKSYPHFFETLLSL